MGRSSFGRIFKRRGRPGYYIRCRVRGKEVTRWAGPDKKTAGEFLAETLRRTAREDLLGEKTIHSISFAEFAAVVETYCRAHHKATTVKGEMVRLRRAVEWFGSTPIREIGEGTVQDFLTSLATDWGVSPATVNRYASTLTVVFKLAIQKSYAAENPVQKLGWQPEQERPVPYITDDDISRLAAHALDERFGDFIHIAADTGLRRSELLRLEWRDLDLSRTVLLVRSSKTYRSREVDLTATARSLFAKLHKDRPATPLKGPDLVWAEYRDKGPDAVSSRFKRTAKRAGMGHLCLHDLRHAFCSRLAQQGVPLATVAKLAGHRSLQTTERYARHIPEGATRAAVDRLGAGKGTPGGTKRNLSS